MPDNYILYPVTKRGLAGELKRALDDYADGKVSNTELASLVAAWVSNCDFMLEGGHLATGVASYLGKRRVSIVERVLQSNRGR